MESRLQAYYTLLAAASVITGGLTMGVSGEASHVLKLGPIHLVVYTIYTRNL